MERLKCVILCVLLSLCLCEGYRILAIFPVPSKSHGILGDNMIKHLLNAGHEVTYITPFMNKKFNHPKLRLIDVSVNDKLVDADSFLDVKLIMDGVVNYQDSDLMFDMMSGMAAATLGNPNVQKLMKEGTQDFDVIIGEYMFSDLYSSFQAVFQCPFIWFSTIDPHWMILNLVDGPANPAYLADYLHALVSPYSFTDRAYELWTQIRGLLRKKFIEYPKEEAVYLDLVAPIIREQGRPVPSLEELTYNSSLLLGNTQVAIGGAIALPPCYKHIGGYHIDEDVKPLPEDLQKIMDGAENGVIYFSMGSNLRSKDLPIDLKKGILKVFEGLKQTVIWKFEEVLADLPKNVHIVQWAPQQSILAHPKLILFITHGGLLSLTEAIHFGVPLISIPVFADQFLNAKRAQEKGFAIKLDLTYSMHEDLKLALDKVLGDPKYAAKAKELSVAYHDRPMKPKDALNYWVEHVVRTRGAPHLRSIAVRLPIYQRMYLDLVAVLLVAFIALVIVIRRVLCMFTKKNMKEKTN